MKLSTKIIIGLIAATMLLAFFGPIIFTNVVCSKMTGQTLSFGPVKTVRVVTDNSDPMNTYWLTCEINSGDVNEARLIAGWPNAAKVRMDYSDADSTLTINCDVTEGSARVAVTLSADDLNSLIAMGLPTHVDIKGINVPMLMVDTEDAQLSFRESHVSNMFVKERVSNAREKEAPSVRIRASSKVDTLFYSVDYARAISINDNVDALIALPGSKVLGDSDSADEDTFTVVIDEQTGD